LIIGGSRGGAPIAAGILIAAGMFNVAPGRAQITMPPKVGEFQGISGAPSIGGQAPQSMAKRPGLPPPAALPGAQSTPGTSAPAHPGTIMDPTEALFDAINRGDIAAARDAVNRGADLNGHNLLGMTPIQLSVDLARNDITFLLLSNGGGQVASSVGGGVGAALLTGTNPSGVRAKPVRQAERRSAKPVQTVSAPAPPQTPRLFAGDGGAPIPSAGFLGFDNGR
jgi:hypothetical protein